MKKAMVIGVNGQDGHFLAKHLLRRGYEVVGLGRQPTSRRDYKDMHYQYRHVDLRRDEALEKALQAAKPEVIFHVAAVHTSAGGAYEEIFGEVLKVNAGSVHPVLEYLRKRGGGTLVYASSGKVFGEHLPGRINEDTPKKNDCLYSISKNTAHGLIDYYRMRHSVSASVLFLFNHESELRPDNFFISFILNSLVEALKDSRFIHPVKTLDFYCDWGSASEYMDIMIDVSERAQGQDYVLGTGNCTPGRDLVELLFGTYGLDYTRVLKPISEDHDTPSTPYYVDTGRLQRRLGRVPNKDIQSLCREILLKKYGI